jgi:integrase/recombinase XerD
LTVRNLAPNTMLCYLKQVSFLARYFGKPPERLGPEEIREYQLYVAQGRKSIREQPAGGPPLPSGFSTALR